MKFHGNLINCDEALSLSVTQLKVLLLVCFICLQEAKKKYDKETEKYCAVLEKHLSLSAKKKESHLHEVRCW